MKSWTPSPRVAAWTKAGLPDALGGAGGAEAQHLLVPESPEVLLSHRILRCRQIPKFSCRTIAETAAVAIFAPAASIFGSFCGICANSVRI